MSEPLPDYPLGLGLRQHMSNYRERLQQLVDDPDVAEAVTRPNEVLAGVVESLDALLDFVDREAAFYGYNQADIRPGVHSLKLHAPIRFESGKVAMKLEVCQGDRTIAEPWLTIESADRIMRGLFTAIEKAKEL